MLKHLIRSLLVWMTVILMSHSGWADVQVSQGYSEEPVIVAYWPGWARRTTADLQHLPQGGITYLVQAFAQPVLNQEDGTVSLMYPYAREEGSQEGAGWSDVVRVSGARTLLSVGGWGLSEDFSDLTVSPAIREKLVECLLQEIRKGGFHGVDLDWEFPVEGGAEGHRHRSQDHDSLLALVKLLRVRLNQLGRETGERYRLTVAVSGDPVAQRQRYHLREMAPWVDWFHLMAYDFAGSWLPVTAHAAALYPVDGHPAVTVMESVSNLLKLGVPAHKIVLGVNLAGKRYEGVVAGAEGPLLRSYQKMDQEAEWRGDNNFLHLYKLLEPSFAQNHNATFDSGWDSVAKASWLYDKQQGVFISWEDRRSVSTKMRFAMDTRLRGMMVWSLDKDGETFPLVRAMMEARRIPLEPQP